VHLLGVWRGVVVKVLRYYSDGPGIDSRWCHWIFQWHIPSGRTMALGLTQPIVKMSTRNISWGVNAAGTWGWQPYHLQVPNVMKSGSLNLLEPSGPHRTCYGTTFLPCVFYYFVLWPTNAQLFHKLLHSYMFRHYRVILRELVINNMPSYTSISNAGVGNTIYN